MTMNYYRNEYTPKQWEALIDKAIELGCVIKWNQYGTIATIDSTAKETALMSATSGSRAMWAEAIHNAIADEARQCWGVFAKGSEVCRVWFNSESKAEQYRQECEQHDTIAHEVRAKF